MLVNDLLFPQSFAHAECLAVSHPKPLNPRFPRGNIRTLISTYSKNVGSMEKDRVLLTLLSPLFDQWTIPIITKAYGIAIVTSQMNCPSKGVTSSAF